MKEISEVNLPEDIRYNESHEWARLEGDSVRIGISDYAQDSLGDITYVELPQVGDVFHKGEEFGTVESTKAVSELFMPVGGEVTAVNTDLAEAPELINQDPYAAGWLLVVKPEAPEEMESLLKSEAYREMVGGLE
ncbi:MAG TPA: glycine cleavage system protein GcvH [Desulfomonilaceae bacterium]|nr:glycine cleavage system protein GcvH [Desulfomonilaceae bacterium]